MSWSCLPPEIWEKILDLLDQTSLLACQEVTHSWKQIIFSYIMSGRLKSRALVSNQYPY